MTSLGPWLGWGRGGDRDWLSTDWWVPFGVDRGLYHDDRGRDIDDTAALAHGNVDWRKTNNAHIFRADLPGVRKEEVKVLVEDGNVLQISGERVKEQEDENDRWHRLERRRGSFVRRLRIPDNVLVDNIKCSLDDGVLEVMTPKKETQKEEKNVRYIDVA